MLLLYSSERIWSGSKLRFSPKILYKKKKGMMNEELLSLMSATQHSTLRGMKIFINVER